MIMKYIRDKNNRLRGLLIGIADSRGFYKIGWSLCHRNDKFDKSKAIFIAMNNLSKDPIHNRILEREYDLFVERCDHYFKVSD